MNYERYCAGCRDKELNTTDDCCNLQLDHDGLPSRCVGPWSEDKLFYLRRYCDIFANGMKNKWRKRVFVDLFSGPGRCRVRPQGDFTEGSPLIALGQPFTNYFFVDLSAHCISALQRRTSEVERTTGKKLNILQDDANSCIDKLVEDIEGLGPDTIGFAFVDPTGIQLHFETLRKLARSPRIDLLVNFPLGMNIQRQIWHQLQKDPDLEGKFDRYFGTNKWRDICSGDQGGTRFRRHSLLQLYEAQLKSLGYAYVGDVRSVKNRGVSLYLLIFASKNPRGREFWENVTRKAPSGQGRLC